MAPPGMEEMTNQLQSMFQSLGSDKTKKRKMKIKDALKTLIDDENPDVVQGGLLAGDRIALIGYKAEDGEMMAQKIINQFCYIHEVNCNIFLNIQIKVCI